MFLVLLLFDMINIYDLIKLGNQKRNKRLKRRPYKPATVKIRKELQAKVRKPVL